MSTGLALYGLENSSAEEILKSAIIISEFMGYPITSAEYFRKNIIKGVDDIEVIEVSIGELLDRIQEEGVSDFRVYSDGGTDNSWLASVGYSSKSFGSFHCLDFQCVENIINIKDKIKCAATSVYERIHFSYGIAYEAKNNIDAMWYARGENLKYIYAYEDRGVFWDVTLGIVSDIGFHHSKKLRMVYAINFLNNEHISIVVQGLSLLDWVADDPERGAIFQVGELWCWEVQQENLEKLNEVLGRESALLAWQQPWKKNKPKLP